MTSLPDMQSALMTKAEEACPAGFEKLSEVIAPRQTWTGQSIPFGAVTWRFRCR